VREGLCVGGCRPDARHEKSRIGAEFPRSYRAGGHASFRHKTVNAGACSRHGRAATFGNQIPTDSGASWRGVFGQVKSTCSCSILWAASGMLHPATLARGNRRKPAASTRHRCRWRGVLSVLDSCPFPIKLAHRRQWCSAAAPPPRLSPPACSRRCLPPSRTRARDPLRRRDAKPAMVTLRTARVALQGILAR